MWRWIVLGTLSILVLFYAYEVYAPVAPDVSGFSDQFDTVSSLKDAPTERQSMSSNWWLSSGGYFLTRDGVASTVIKSLPEEDERRVVYARSNPTDTDNGYHPQNIFRLVQRGQWENFVQEVQFKITADNVSESTNRNESNGVLLFNRYVDEHSLYYTGLRVDGYAVIKKKYAGEYYTMAYQRVVPGTYDWERLPNLLPKDTWIGLRSVVSTDEGVVHIALYADMALTGDWTLVAEARDDGKAFGNTPIIPAGHGGIRTDFMDVEFDAYQIQSTRVSSRP